MYVWSACSLPRAHPHTTLSPGTSAEKRPLFRVEVGAVVEGGTALGRPLVADSGKKTSLMIDPPGLCPSSNSPAHQRPLDASVWQSPDPWSQPQFRAGINHGCGIWDSRLR